MGWEVAFLVGVWAGVVLGWLLLFRTGEGEGGE